MPSKEMLHKTACLLMCTVVYGCVYGALQRNSSSHFGFRTSVDPFYFSVVTGSTVGYGDYRPGTDCAKLVVMSHVLCVVWIVIST